MMKVRILVPIPAFVTHNANVALFQGFPAPDVNIEIVQGREESGIFFSREHHQRVEDLNCAWMYLKTQKSRNSEGWG